jgi:hypothetical protein
MKKSTMLLMAMLAFLLTAFPRHFSVAADCPNNVNAEESPVQCWLKKNQEETLKAVKKQLETAHNIVWNLDKRQSLKTNILLKSLAFVPREELNQRGLNTSEDGYQGVTWMSKDFAQLALKAQAQKKNKGVLTLDQYVWITPASQTQTFCKTCQGSLSNSDIPEIIKLRLRLIQYLGLILDDSNQSNFVTITAKKSDIIRPCLDQEISDDRCNPLTSQQERTNFINENPNLISEKYPWTALGYTYDWGKQTENVGASEYAIKPGSTVFIESVKTTKDFCQR